MAMYQAKGQMGAPSGSKKGYKNLCDAMQVTPNKTGGWTVLVQVVEKRKERESRSCAGLMYKNYILIDMKGTRVPAVTFGSNVAILDKIMFPFKMYYVSNAGVNDAKEEYKVGEYQYNWVLNYRTPVHPVEDTVPHTLPCPFQFTRFSDMHKFADRDESVAFKALVVDSHTISGSEGSAIRNYIVIKQEKTPMIMRLWSDWLDNSEVQVSSKFPDPTIFVGPNMKVTTHNVISLTTKTNGYLMVNPPLPGNDELMGWYNENAKEIAHLLDAKAYRNADFLIPPPSDSDIVPIQDILSSIERLKTVRVVAIVSLIPGRESLWHSVCEKCNRSVDAHVGWNMFCTSCAEDIEVVPRSRYGVFLIDDTSRLPTILYSPDAEHLTNYTAQQVYEAEQEGNPLNKAVEAVLCSKKVFCFLKYFETDFHGEMVKKYPILKVYTVDEVASRNVVLVDVVVGTDSSTQLADTQDAPSVHDQQFFSPTAKKVLDDIDNASVHAKTSDGQGYVVKRALVFGEGSSEAISGVSDLRSELTTEVNDAAIASCESPIKKVKNKEKVKQN